MIYLDNAATTLNKPDCVIDAVVHAMKTMGNSARGAHVQSLTASRSIYAAREKLASLFGCSSPQRVIFTANSTEALNIAISGTFQPGDHILSTDLEHNSVLRPLFRLRQSGIETDYLPADRMGRLNYDDLERMLRPNTRGIVCTHASNLTGQMLDLERIGRFVEKHHLIWILDASQTAGVFPIDMSALPIGIVCFTGHKSLMGPQGTGGLCISAGVEIRPWKVGGTGVQSHLATQPEEYPVRLEAGTLNGHGIAGLSAALDYIQNIGMDRIRSHELQLARQFYEGVRDIPGVRLYGDFSDAMRAPIVALNLEGMDCSEAADLLAGEYGISVRAGAHCAPRLHNALGTGESGSVRFSFGWFNTAEEAEAAIAAVRELAKT